MYEYGYDYDAANDVLFYTAENKKSSGRDSEWKTPNAEGFITVRYYGLSRFTVEDYREFPRKRLAIRPDLSYNREGKGSPIRDRREKGTRHMPPARGRRAATAPAPPAEPESNGSGEVDFQKYISKDLSPTMSDYVEWFEQEVASLDDIPVDKILVLGVSLYGHFQKSDFNIDRREARRATRAPAPEPEPEPAKPARGGRGRSRAAAAPAPEHEPEPEATPARRGRGRPSRAGARAGAEAPY
jgi:hypothetical protein